MSLGIMGIVIIDGVINMALLALDIGIMSPISLLVASLSCFPFSPLARAGCTTLAGVADGRLLGMRSML